MQKLLAKKLNKKGFTLAELLIVVAIIAVLVAIAVPIFTGALEKARLGVHRSNARNLKSMAVAAILADSGFEEHSSTSGWKVIGKYDFTEQKFEIIQISAATITSPKLKVSEGSVASVDDTGMLVLGDPNSDGKIGKIPTNGIRYYYAEIVATDFSNKVSWGN